MFLGLLVRQLGHLLQLFQLIIPNPQNLVFDLLHFLVFGNNGLFLAVEVIHLFVQVLVFDDQPLLQVREFGPAFFFFSLDPVTNFTGFFLGGQYQLFFFLLGLGQPLFGFGQDLIRFLLGVVDLLLGRGGLPPVPQTSAQYGRDNTYQDLH